MTSVAVLFIFILTARQIFDSRLIIGLNLVVVFFFSGLLSTSFNLPDSAPHNIANKFLPGDKVKVQILEYSKGEKFDKTIAEVSNVIQYDDTVFASGKILLYIDKTFGLVEIGDELIVNTDLISIKNDGNPGEFNQEKFWRNNGIELQCFAMSENLKKVGSNLTFQGFWYNIRQYLIYEMQEKLDNEVYGLTTALALGDKSLLKKETRDNFANAGAMHVLAVSGLHVGILLGIIQWLAGKVTFLRRKNRHIVIAVVVIWIFAFLTGLSPSVLRASIMFSILAFGQTRGVSFFNLNSLLVSALILLILDPLLLFNIGFQLSYLAMFGISFFYQPISKFFFFKNKWLRKIWEGTALGIAAQIGTVPISLYYFHQFPNYFALTNIGFMVLAGVALTTVLAFFIFHAVPFLSDLIVEVVNYVFKSIHWFVEFINYLPYPVAKGFSPSIWLVVATYCLILFLVIAQRNRNAVFFNWSLSGLAVCTFLFVFNRFTNLEKREIAILNAKHHVVLVKNRGQLFCFYDERAIKMGSNIDYFVDNYQKQYGGNRAFYQLPNSGNQQEVVLNNLSTPLVISNENDYYSIKLGEKEKILPIRNQLSEVNSSKKVLIGKFVRNFKGEHLYDTRNGAYIFRE